VKRTPTSELAFARRIANRNAKFLKASPERQRVMLAEDIIAGLDSGEYRARSGTYLAQRDFMGDGSEERCVGCALGLTFVACLSATGGRVSVHTPVHVMRSTLSMFSEETLLQMEAAFEGWGAEASRGGNAETEAFNRSNGGERFDDDEKCLRRVMLNIIRHRGEFVPSDRR
jgi:hypothetical protein